MEFWYLTEFSCCSVSRLINYTKLFAFTVSRDQILSRGKTFGDIQNDATLDLFTLFFEFCRRIKRDKFGSDARLFMETVSNEEDTAVRAYTFWLLVGQTDCQTIFEEIVKANTGYAKSMPTRDMASKSYLKSRDMGLTYRYLQNLTELKDSLQKHVRVIFAGQSDENVPTQLSGQALDMFAIYSITNALLLRSLGCNSAQSFAVVLDHIGRSEFSFWRPGYFYELRDVDQSPSKILSKLLPDVQCLIHPLTAHKRLDVLHILSHSAQDPLDRELMVHPAVDAPRYMAAREVLHLGSKYHGQNNLRFEDATTLTATSNVEYQTYLELKEESDARITAVNEARHCKTMDSVWTARLEGLGPEDLDRFVSLAYTEHQNIVADRLYANFREGQDHVSVYHRAIMDYADRKVPSTQVVVDDSNDFFVATELERWNQLFNVFFTSADHMEEMSMLLLVMLDSHNPGAMEEVTSAYILHTEKQSFGKSFMLKLLSELAIPYTVNIIQYASTKAYNSSDPEQSGEVRIYDDCSGDLLGIGKGADIDQKRASLKQMLTGSQNSSITLSITNKGKRVTQECRSTRLNVLLIGNNYRYIRSKLDPLIRSRMMIISLDESAFAKKMGQFAHEQYLSAKGERAGEMTMLKARLMNRSRWEQIVSMEIYRLIRVHGLESVNTLVPMIIWGELERALQNKSVPVHRVDLDRNRWRYFALCMSACLREIADRHFLTVGGKFAGKTFDPRMLVDPVVDSELFVTSQQAICVLGLIPELLFHQHTTTVRQGLYYHLIENVNDLHLNFNSAAQNWISFKFPFPPKYMVDHLNRFSTKLNMVMSKREEIKMVCNIDEISEILTEHSIEEFELHDWRLPRSSMYCESSNLDNFLALEEDLSTPSYMAPLVKIQKDFTNSTVTLTIHLSMVHPSKMLPPGRELLLTLLKEVFAKRSQGGFKTMFGRIRETAKIKSDFLSQDYKRVHAAYNNCGRPNIVEFPLASITALPLSWHGNDLQESIDVIAAMQRAAATYTTPHPVPAWQKQYDIDNASNSPPMFFGQRISDNSDVLTRLREIFDNSSKSNSDSRFEESRAFVDSENCYVWQSSCLSKAQYHTRSVSDFLRNWNSSISSRRLMFLEAPTVCGDEDEHSTKTYNQLEVDALNLRYYKLVAATPRFRDFVASRKTNFEKVGLRKRPRETEIATDRDAM